MQYRLFCHIVKCLRILCQTMNYPFAEGVTILSDPIKVCMDNESRATNGSPVFRAKFLEKIIDYTNVIKSQGFLITG